MNHEVETELKMLLEPFRDFTLEVVPSGETGRG